MIVTRKQKFATDTKCQSYQIRLGYCMQVLLMTQILCD